MGSMEGNNMAKSKAARIKELEAIIGARVVSEANGATPRYDEDGKLIEDIMTCGTCGTSWNDALISERTPTPSARCPYEYEHQDIAELRRLKSNRARKKSTKALPPDPENQNDDRAEWAEAAIKAFIKVTRTDRGDALADLLCDLMHWADRNDEEATGNEEMQDFDQALARARMHYTEETMRSDDSPEETPIDPIHAAKHYMDKSDDPGHGPDSACEVCKFHLVHG